MPKIGQTTQQKKPSVKQDSLFKAGKNAQITTGAGKLPVNPVQEKKAAPVQESLKSLSETNQAYFERMLQDSQNVKVVNLIRQNEELGQKGVEVIEMPFEKKFKQVFPVAKTDNKGRNIEAGALSEAQKSFAPADLCTVREEAAMKEYFATWKNADGPKVEGHDTPNDPGLADYVESIISFPMTDATFTDDYMSEHMPVLYEYCRKLSAYESLSKAYPKFFETIPETTRVNLGIRVSMKDDLRALINEHMSLHGVIVDPGAKKKEDRVKLRKESDNKNIREADRRERASSYDRNLKGFLRKHIDGYNLSLAKFYAKEYTDTETTAEKVSVDDLEEKIRTANDDAFDACGTEMEAAIAEIKSGTAVRNELVQRQRGFITRLDTAEKNLDKLKKDLEDLKQLKTDKEGKALSKEALAERRKSIQTIRESIRQEEYNKKSIKRDMARTNRRLRIVNEHIDRYREFINFGMGELDEVSPKTAQFLEKEGHEDMLAIIRFKVAGDCIEKVLAARDKLDELGKIAKLRAEKNPAKKQRSVEEAMRLEQQFRESLSYVKMPRDRFYSQLIAHRKSEQKTKVKEDPVMTLLRDERITEDVTEIARLISDDKHPEIVRIFAPYTKKLLGFNSVNPDKITDKDKGDIRSYLAGSINLLIKESVKNGVKKDQQVKPPLVNMMHEDAFEFSLRPVERDRYNQVRIPSRSSYWKNQQDTEDYYSGDQKRVNRVLMDFGREMLDFSVTEEMKDVDRFLDTTKGNYLDNKTKLMRARGFRVFYMKHKTFYDGEAFTEEEKKKLKENVLENAELDRILAVAELYKVPFAPNPNGEKIDDKKKEKETEEKRFNDLQEKGKLPPVLKEAWDKSVLETDKKESKEEKNKEKEKPKVNEKQLQLINQKMAFTRDTYLFLDEIVKDKAENERGEYKDMIIAYIALNRAEQDIWIKSKEGRKHLTSAELYAFREKVLQMWEKSEHSKNLSEKDAALWNKEHRIPELKENFESESMRTVSIALADAAYIQKENELIPVSEVKYRNETLRHKEVPDKNDVFHGFAYEKQDRGNDCWSVAVAAMVNYCMGTKEKPKVVGQKDVRKIKPEFREKLKDEEQKDYNEAKEGIELFTTKNKPEEGEESNRGNIFAMADYFRQQCGHGYALRHAMLNLSKAKHDDELNPKKNAIHNMTQVFRNEVRKAIDSGQAVAILRGGHYTVITAANEAGITRLNSLGKGKTHESTYEEFINESAGFGTIELTFLQRIDSTELVKKYKGLKYSKEQGFSGGDEKLSIDPDKVAIVHGVVSTVDKAAAGLTPVEDYYEEEIYLPHQMQKKK